MPDISYQMQLLKQMQDPNSESSPMGAMRALGRAIGNAWQGHEAGTDEKDLVDFFTKNDTTPEKMQEFMGGHPRMPQVDVYTKASIIGRQKKMKDVIDSKKNLEGYIRSYGEPPQDKSHWDGILQGSATIEDVSSALKAWKEAYPEAKLTQVDTEKDLYETIGGKTRLKKLGVKKEKATVWVMSRDGKTIRLETPTEARRLIKDEGLTKYEKPNAPQTMEPVGIDPISKRNVYKSDKGNVFKDGTPAPEGQVLSTIEGKDDEVLLYKGSGRNIVEKKVKKGEKQTHLAQGWKEERPVFAPPDPEVMEFRRDAATEKTAAAALKKEEDRITDNIRRNDAKIKFYQAAIPKEKDKVKKKSYQLTIDGFIKNNEGQEEALSHLRRGGKLNWNAAATGKGGGEPSAPPLKAKNPATGVEIFSTDGGNTWKDSKGNIVR